MNKNCVLIIGSGHLGYRLEAKISQLGFEILHTSTEDINAKGKSISLIDNLKSYLEKIDLATIQMIYLLDDKDEHNLQLIILLISMYPSIPVTASLFNENLIPHLQTTQSNLTVINPAKIAAPAFVSALDQEINRSIITAPVKHEEANKTKYRIPLIQKLLLGFIGLLLFSILYFHFYENLSWIDALYFTVVTAATVGYGDINFSQASGVSKLINVILIIGSSLGIWLIFSLTIDLLLKQRIQIALGRKKYHYENHIIVCGLGRLGYFIVEELLKRNEKVIIIENNEDNKHIDYFRHLGAEVYIGDARLSKVVTDVSVSKAQALISVINDDSINIEIGLNARIHQPQMRLILRIFDDQMAEKIKQFLNIHLTLSTSVIVDDMLYELLTKRNSTT